MRLKDFGLIAKDSFIYKGNSRKSLNDRELASILIEKGVPIADLNTLQTTLLNEAKNSSENELSFEEYREARRLIFEKCVYHRYLKTIKDETGIKAYIASPDGWRCLGLAKELDAKYLLKEFTEKYGTFLRDLTSEINSISPPTKNNKIFKHEEVAEMYIEDIMPSEEKWVINSMTSPPSPLLLKGDPRPAFGYLEYIPVDKPVMNPHMSDFLLRMHNHEYFCAYIYCTFLGIEIQQLLYVYGEGQNGKSSFTKVLANKTRSVAAYSVKSKHDFVHLEGKAFVVIPESEGGHVLQDANIKKITGKDLITIDPKFKQAYSGRIQGTIIIDSNNLPYIVGEKSETRRMRFFEMQAVKSQETIDANIYVDLMSENFNDFINYCRICYEKHKHENGVLIKDPPDLEQQLENLIDPDMVASYKKMLKSLSGKWKLELDKTLSISSEKFRESIASAISMLHGKFEDKYFSKNFVKYLKCKKLITEEGGVIHGIGEVDPTKDRAILEALPKY